MLTSYVDDVYLDNLARDLFMRYKGTQAKRTWTVYKWREPPSHHGMTSLSFQARKRDVPPTLLKSNDAYNIKNPSFGTNHLQG